MQERGLPRPRAAATATRADLAGCRYCFEVSNRRRSRRAHWRRASTPCRALPDRPPRQAGIGWGITIVRTATVGRCSTNSRSYGICMMAF